jgi:hypothetical protein
LELSEAEELRFFRTLQTGKRLLNEFRSDLTLCIRIDLVGVALLTTRIGEGFIRQFE